MEKYFFLIFINLLISAVIYFGIAAVFILIGKRKKPALDEGGLTFDEAFIAEQFEPVISQYTVGQVKLLPDLSHMGVIVSPEVPPVVKEWLKSLGPLKTFRHKESTAF